MTGKRRRLMLLFALVFMLAPARLSAQTTSDLDVRIDRDMQSSSIDTDLLVNLLATITERSSGSPPAEDFEVYAFGRHQNGTTTDRSPCGQLRENDPEAPPGVYRCTVVIDYGGIWDFVAVVNQERRTSDEIPKELARGTLDVTIETDAVAPERVDTVIQGSASAVAILFGHTLFAAAWFAALGTLAAVALPGLRSRLSTTALHRLETRLDLLVKGFWTATGLTIGSGIYLLLKETAYETPFSSSAIDGVFGLPYGKPYFLSLWAKLALYAFALLASVAIAREARRQQRLSFGLPPKLQPSGPDVSERLAIWGGEARSSGGRTALAARPTAAVSQSTRNPAMQRRSARAARLATIVVLSCGSGIMICVTLLKYFHQLIEAV